MADYLLAPALLYDFTGTWLNALVPQVPIWVFIVIFVAINTFVTGRGITVTARTNFALLGLELAAGTIGAIKTKGFREKPDVLQEL
jgi:hypothetical protein